MVTGIDKDSYLEYENLREFHDWVLNLKPKDVRDKGISQQALYKIKTRIKIGKHLNLKVKVVSLTRNTFREQIWFHAQQFREITNLLWHLRRN